VQKPENLLRGMVRVEVTAAYPERFVNMCAANNIEFWDMERDGVTLRCSINHRSFGKLRELTPKYGFELRRLTRRGLPHFAKRMRRRVALILGIVMVVAAIRVASLFVWEISVVGNETVPTRDILTALDECGFRVGVFTLNVSSEKLANDMIMRIPELRWLAVNLNGSHADVLVRERVPKPELVDYKTPTSIIAAKSGVITRMTVLEGLPQTELGATVQAGDVLVSGVYASAGGTRNVHAQAVVEARTWYELSAQMTLTTTTKRYTGESKTYKNVIFGGKSKNLFGKTIAPAQYCDKMVTSKLVTLPGGVALPIEVVTTRYDVWEPVPARVQERGAELLLKDGLQNRLLASVGGGEVLTVDWETAINGDVMTVTLRAECREIIGTEQVIG
jgi:similar to stage IV sporulation protein